MEHVVDLTSIQMLLRLLIAALIGGVIGFERRSRHKPIGIAGMMLVAIGSASYMMLAMYLSGNDPASVSRALQHLLQGIGFLGGAVIFKTVAAIWITGAIGLAVGTWFIDDFPAISNRTPLLADLKPSGQYVMEELYEVGGVPFGAS